MKKICVDIIKYDLQRSPNIGIYAKVNDSFVFVPNGFTKSKTKKLCEYLDVEDISTSVGNTRLLGVLMVANNNGILLPHICYESEFLHIKKSTGMNIGVLDAKFTALGNLVCANDKGAIVSPAFTREDVKKIKDVLGVEVLQKRIAGYHQVGAMICATGHGGIIHPETDDEVIKSVSNVLGVELEPATINGGIPFVSSGILANNNSIVVGSFTNGPEIMMLTRAFI